MLVHARLPAALHVVGKGVGRHRENRYRLRVRPVQAANAPRGLQPVHHGHHHIHQNHVDVARFGGGKRVHRLPSVRRLRHNHALVLQHELGDFHVQVVIFHQQHLRAADGNRPAVRVVVGALGILILFKGQVNGKRRADVLFALQRNFAAHLFHQLFDDGQTEARAHVRGTRARVLLRKRFKRPLLERLAHAIARVAHDKLKGNGVLRQRDFA